MVFGDRISSADGPLRRNNRLFLVHLHPFRVNQCHSTILQLTEKHELSKRFDVLVNHTAHSLAPNSCLYPRFDSQLGVIGRFNFDIAFSEVKLADEPSTTIRTTSWGSGPK